MKRRVKRGVWPSLCPFRLPALPRCAAVLAACAALLLGAGLCAQEPPNTSETKSEDYKGRIVVRVLDETGTPFLGLALVRLKPPEGAARGPAGLHEDGSASFTELAKGPYTVEVTAPGYHLATEETAIEEPREVREIYLALRPEVGPPGADPAAGPGNLEGKALQAAQRALSDMRAGDLKKAQNDLEEARKLAPGHPEIHYLHGVLCMQEGNLGKAKESLENAVRLFPGHVGALQSLGEVLYRQGDMAGAAKRLAHALDLNPGTWQAQWLLAGAYFRLGQFERAAHHAGLAVQGGKEKAQQAELLQARALIALGDSKGAEAALERFLTASPDDQAAGVARALLANLRGQNTTTAATAGESPASVAAAEAAPMPWGVWAPADIDEAVAPVASGLRCPAARVLEGASRRALELTRNLQRFSATEALTHRELGGDGKWKGQETRSYEYVMGIEEVRDAMLAVYEYRDGKMGEDMFPAKLATRGLPALALVFHPFLSKGFNFTCEGLGKIEGHPAWQVRFEQKADMPSLLRSHRMKGKSYPIALKGRAWIDANQFQVLRLETSLVRPYPEVHLAGEHLSVDYTPVELVPKKIKLWLPERAEVYLDLNRRRVYRQHRFSDFVLFSVDSTEKIEDPKELKQQQKQKPPEK